MNVLLVDDQVRILEATSKLVDWKKLHVDMVYTASSAKAAREILSTYPIDIMLADIEMPEENGISLRKWQMQNYPDTACIFLTSHADFSYAKDAIRDGVFDYILQPASISEIENVMERCISTLQEKAVLENKGRQYDSQMPDVLKNYIFTLFFRKNKLFSMDDWRRDSGTLESDWRYLPCLLEYWRTDKVDVGAILEEELGIFWGDMCQFVVSSLSEGENAFLLYTRETPLKRLCIKEKMQNMLERIRERTGCELNIYIGRYAQDDLHEKTVELMDSIEGRVLKHNNVYLAETIRVSSIKRPDSTVWARWLIQNDGKLIKNQITNLLRFAEQEQSLSIDYMQQLLQTVLEACSIACYDQGRNISELFVEEGEYGRILKSYISIPEVISSVDFCLRRYDKVICGKKETDDLYSACERIREIPRYLSENMDRMISRKEASKYVFLNEDYFSRIFRKEYGVGYKEYMLKQKMEYAKRLLEGTDMPVSVIASKVGYENYANFIQMFRKVEKMTPKEYRKKYHKEGKETENKSQN